MVTWKRPNIVISRITSENATNKLAKTARPRFRLRLPRYDTAGRCFSTSRAIAADLAGNAVQKLKGEKERSIVAREGTILISSPTS
jgi:hypothetical protein